MLVVLFVRILRSGRLKVEFAIAIDTQVGNWKWIRSRARRNAHMVLGFRHGTPSITKWINLRC